MLSLTTTLSTMMRGTRYLAGALLLISICYVSCGRQDPTPVTDATGGQRGPSTAAERMLVSRISDVAAVLESVYSDPAALAEVNTAIASGYYHDERVLLADLLYPEESGLYSYLASREGETASIGNAENFDGSVRRGAFADRFRVAAAVILGEQRANSVFASAAAVMNSTASPVAGEVPVFPDESSIKGDTSFSEGLSVIAGASGHLRSVPSRQTARAISIYYPYSADFSATDLLNRGRPLIVPASVEADWVEVPDPACGLRHRHNAASCSKIRVDDAYAMKNPVHIVGSGAEPSRQKASDRRLLTLAQGEALADTGEDGPVPVFLGRVKCTRQYDRFISFTGNGGGSELKFIRGEGYATLNNDQQVTDTEFDIISVYFRRKDIRKEREKDVYAVWDPHWEPECTEQVFGIYEEDTRGELEFSGSVKTEVEHPGGESTITPIGYSYSVYSQDEIIRQINWSRVSFFHYNQSNLAGCGFRDGFAWYDCRLSVSYSTPAGNR